MWCITEREPYAWCIGQRQMDLLNRRRLHPWATHVGSRIAIHASKAWSDQGAADPLVQDLIGRRPQPHDVSFAPGCIIATAVILDVHVAEDEGCCDPWGHPQVKHTASVDPVVHVLLDSVRATPRIPAVGQLGMWGVPDDVRRELEAAGVR